MSNNRKYEFTGETLTTGDGRTLRRIRRLSDGEIGGWIESESNLSHDGSCWVSGSARVSGEARVFDSALVYGSARVFGSAWVFDSARVSGEAEVSGEALVSGSARVFGEAQVFGEARVSGEARVFGKSKVSHTPITANLGCHSILVDDEWLVSIGCQQWPLDHWLENGARIGADNGYSTSDIRKYLKFLRYLRSIEGEGVE